MHQINQQYEVWKRQQKKLSFDELEKEILNYNAKSEYKQVTIHIVRQIFEKQKFSCSCGTPDAIRLCEGIEYCMKCGDKL